MKGGYSPPSRSTGWSPTPKDEANQLKRGGRPARPDRARHRRDHRHRHLRHPRRGDRRRRAGDHALVHPRRHHVRLLGALLRRAGLEHPGLRQRLHVRLRDDGRARGVDHRLGPDPRVRRLGGGGRGRLGQYFNDLLDSLFGLSLPESLANPPGEGGAFNLPAVFLVLAVTALLIFGVRESARTNAVMVVDQARDRRPLHRAGVHGLRHRQPVAVQPGGLRRRRDRRVGDLLRLHRLRRDLHLGRGGREPGAQPADRDHRARWRSARCSTSSSSLTATAARPVRQDRRRRRRRWPSCCRSSASTGRATSSRSARSWRSPASC